MTKKLTNAERLTALENNLGNLTNDVQALSRSVALLVNALNPTVEEAPKTKKAAPAKDKPKTKKADAPKAKKADKAPVKKAEPTLRLDKAEALELMVTSWHNRAAAAYDRRKGGNGAVKYADFTAAMKKAITADDKAKGKTSLLASKKWKDAVARHGIKESDLKW